MTPFEWHLTQTGLKIFKLLKSARVLLAKHLHDNTCTFVSTGGSLPALFNLPMSYSFFVAKPIYLTPDENICCFIDHIASFLLKSDIDLLKDICAGYSLGS